MKRKRYNGGFWGELIAGFMESTVRGIRKLIVWTGVIIACLIILSGLEVKITYNAQKAKSVFIEQKDNLFEKILKVGTTGATIASLF